MNQNTINSTVPTPLDSPTDQARSGIASENIQEIMDAETSAEWAVQGGQNQYFTPEHLARDCWKRLMAEPQYVRSIHDPQCGDGALLQAPYNYYASKCGFEIDNRVTPYGVNLIQGNCVKSALAMDEVFPGTVFEVVNANCPYGKRWKLFGQMIDVFGKEWADSTEWTWWYATTHGQQGFFIANQVTIERLEIHQHPFVFHYETRENVWENCTVVIGIVFWRNPEAKATPQAELSSRFIKLQQIIKEEKGHVPPYNIWLDSRGKIDTYLSTRAQVEKKLTEKELIRLAHVKGKHPLNLTVEKETRKLLEHLVECGFYTIEPKALAAIKAALVEIGMDVPIMPVKKFAKTAQADEEETLLCINSAGLRFTPGKRYDISTGTYRFERELVYVKPHFDEKTGETRNVDHQCLLFGEDRYIEVTDDRRQIHRFMHNPRPDRQNDHDEDLLWKIFQEPEVPTIAEKYPHLVEANKKILRSCELLAGFEYYPGQRDFLSRIACKDYGYVAAGTGTGKTLMAISLAIVKAPKRTLIVAPQGTMKSSEIPELEEEENAPEYQASQWVQELRTFAPFLQVFELFSLADYQRIIDANGGQLPPGVYISYYDAMFKNGGHEWEIESWDDEKLCKVYGWPPYKGSTGKRNELNRTLGVEKNGIRCLCKPTLATLIGHEFDMVLLDEAHVACHLDANRTQMIIRMQPRYRFALSATPIPNIVTNLFPLMGWLCVQEWYKGDRRNAAWPFAREDEGHFATNFLSKLRDYTEEDYKKAADPTWSGRCIREWPMISSPARLLKILSKSMAYLSKQMCNPKLVECTVQDVRVPLGVQQAQLYRHFLNRGNINCGNALIRARKQIAYLRGICADPADFEYGGPKVASNFNPKTVAVMTLVRDILKQGEQVVIVSARKAQTSTYHWLLRDAKVPVSRIDSTVPADMHSYQSNLFKARKTQVMLMGIKCAMGYSFQQCPNLIIASLEYTYGSKEQAEGRVWRVNSPKPVRIFCVLHKYTIEELMFNIVATKQDAATICLYGERIPRDYKPVDMQEILAKAIEEFSINGSTPETECEEGWPKLRDEIARIVTTQPLATA